MLLRLRLVEQLLGLASRKLTPIRYVRSYTAQCTIVHMAFSTDYFVLREI